MSCNFDSIKRYQTCMRMVGKIMALNVEKNYASEEQVSKLRRLYKLTPMKAIKGILAVTNPVKVSLLDLLDFSFSVPPSPFLSLSLANHPNTHIINLVVTRPYQHILGTSVGHQQSSTENDSNLY